MVAVMEGREIYNTTYITTSSSITAISTDNDSEGSNADNDKY